jgi:uncharacterized protein YlaI
MECDKVKYIREHQARKMAEIFRKQGKPMTTYYCKGCKAFHLTKKKRS